MKARQGRMEGEAPSVNKMDRIKENIRTRDHASSFSSHSCLREIMLEE